jgi:hypothetical protein
MQSPLRERSSHRWGVVLGMALAVVACTTSEEDMGPPPTTGTAGTSAQGAAGTSPMGAAGTSATGAGGSSSSGAAGTSAATGAAGTKVDAGVPGSGAAGTSNGSAGSLGKAGTGGGMAGTSGGAGSSGAAGTTGAAGTSAMQWVYSGVGGIENVLINNCGGCHFMAAGVTIQGGFWFSYANVTGVVTSGNKACVGLDASKRRVVPGKPENSLLYIKISQDKPAAGCGGHMPYQGQSVNANVLGWIRDWILQGAKEK